MISIFVYGTLKDHSKSDDWFVNGRLYSITSWFPGIKLNCCSPKKIVGQIIEVDEEKLRILDYIEGVPNLYDRKQVLVFSTGTPLICRKAFVYEYQGSIDNKMEIDKWPIL